MNLTCTSDEFWHIIPRTELFQKIQEKCSEVERYSYLTNKMLALGTRRPSLLTSQHAEQSNGSSRRGITRLRTSYR
jgi:hypothetical protein